MTEQGAVPTAAGSTARRRPPPLLAAAAIGVIALVLLPLVYPRTARGHRRPGGLGRRPRPGAHARARRQDRSSGRPRYRGRGRARRSARLARRPERSPRPPGVGRRGGAPARHPELRRGTRPSRRLRAARPPPGGARAARRRPGARDLRPLGRGPRRSRSPPTRTSTCSRSPPSATSTPGSRTPGAASGSRGSSSSGASRSRSFGPRSEQAPSSSLSTPCRTSVQCRSCGYDSLTRAIFLQYRSLFDRTPAAVLALVLVLLTAVVLVLELRTRGRGALHRSSPGAARLPHPSRSAAGAGPRSVSAPFGRLRAGRPARRARLLARARRFSRCPASASSWEPGLSSVLVSLGAAAIAVAAAIPVAVLAVRYASGWTRGLERLAYAGNALPGS